MCPIQSGENGGPARNLGEPKLPLVSKYVYPHDFTPIFIKNKETIFDKTWPLFQSGMSLREIASTTGIPKSTIRGTFLKKGVVQEGNPQKTTKARAKSHQRTGGVASYGYCWLNGKLVIDPREHKIVQVVIQLNQQGKSLRQIAKHLNAKKYPTRSGKGWATSVVQSILNHHKSKNKDGGLT